MSEANAKFSRREFLSRSSAGLTAFGVMGVGGEVMLPPEMKFKKDKKIITRVLGNTGIRLPIVSMGVMNADNPEVVAKSYEIGIRMFDTAELYQNTRNEAMVGEVIAKLGVRDKVVIATKLWHPEMIKRQMKRDYTDLKSDMKMRLDSCLKRLRSDFVEILYLHMPANVDFINQPEIIEFFAEAKKEGKIKFAGMSTHTNQAVKMERAIETGIYDVILVAVNFTMANDTKLFEVCKKAHEKGIGLVAMKTQAGGRGMKKYPNLNQTGALKWALRNELFATAIPGYTNFAHMNEDFSVAYGLEYTEDEKKFLADQEAMGDAGYCRMCEKCVPTCKYKANIPELMRTHMYASNYANFAQARFTYDTIEAKRSLDVCSLCDTCTAQCAHYVDIPHSINRLKAIFG